MFVLGLVAPAVDYLVATGILRRLLGLNPALRSGPTYDVMTLFAALFILLLAHFLSYGLELERDWALTLTELGEAIGITLPNLSILKTNIARAIRFSMLDAICRVLECQPGNLLEYVQVPEQLFWILAAGDSIEARS